MTVGPLVILWCPVWVGFGVHKWTYFTLSSWRHGTAYLGRIKLVW